MSLPKLWRNFFCFMSLRTRRALPRTNLHLSVFHTCATCPKETSVSSVQRASATLGNNQKGPVCCCCSFFPFVNDQIWHFKKLSVLPLMPYCFFLMIFRNKYVRAITTGMYALFHVSQASNSCSVFQLLFIHMPVTFSFSEQKYKT